VSKSQTRKEGKRQTKQERDKDKCDLLFGCLLSHARGICNPFSDPFDERTRTQPRLSRLLSCFGRVDFLFHAIAEPAFCARICGTAQRKTLRFVF
jgi:hypothetical protein